MHLGPEIPPVLHRALLHFGISVDIDADTLIRWTDRHLQTPVRCGGSISEQYRRIAEQTGQPYPQRGAGVHVIRFERHTLEPVEITPPSRAGKTAGTPCPGETLIGQNKMDAVAADHFLWALSNGTIPTGCEWAHAVVTSVANTATLHRSIRATSWTIGRLLAIRTLARASTYVENSLPLDEHAFALAHGLPVESAAELARLTKRGGVPRRQVEAALNGDYPSYGPRSPRTAAHATALITRLFTVQQ